MLARERLRAARLQAGLSQEDLAAVLGCHQTYVGLVETGKRCANLAFAQRIETLSRAWKGGPIRCKDWVESNTNVQRARRQSERRAS